jgi:hypothetical protein
MNDHQRGCAGRDYTCTCGYDDARDSRLEAFKQEVSDALVIYSPENRNPALGRFIITKPDPLVEVLKDFGGYMPDAEDFRAALKARGLEIRSMNDEQ